jgi:outer membrane lipoprotein-sorting protein
MNPSRLFSFVAFFLLLSFGPAFAQPSADEVIAKVDQQINSGAAIKMKFSVPGQGSFSILADLGARRARIVAGNMTIVTDGATVWNYNKTTNQLTIDALSNNPNSALKSPQGLFKFSTNYSAEMLEQHGSTYTIKLTPNAQVHELMASLGDVSSLTFTVTKSRKGYTIKKALLERNSGKTTISSLTVTSVKSVSHSDFTFSAPAGAKTVDLRE